MARRWTLREEARYRDQLVRLYVEQNKTINEIAELLRIGESTVFDRLRRLTIPTMREAKPRCNNQRRIPIHIPEKRTASLAEFFGIMLGDGHVSHFQTVVTLGTKEPEYAEHVSLLMARLFGVPGTICLRKDGYRDVYIGSVKLTAWLRQEGLVSNKVAAQVGVPLWVFRNRSFMNAFLRGFFDTDGSVYRLRFGRQIELTNRSLPILHALQRMLSELGYRPSAVSSSSVYLTRRQDVDRFFAEIQPANAKHLRRFAEINLTRRYPSG